MRHRTDGVSLTFGVLFLAVAGLWLASQVASLHAVSIAWLAVGMLVLLGVAGIIGVVVNAARSRTEQDTGRHAGDLEH